MRRGGERCNGARGGAWQQPAPTNIPEMFENSGTRRQSYVTATRGAEAGIIKGGLPAPGQTVSESAPEKRLPSLRLLRQHLEEKDTRRLGPRLTALRAHSIPLLAGLLASVSPRSPRFPLRATMSSSTARALAVAVTLLHLIRLVSWTFFFF